MRFTYISPVIAALVAVAAAGCTGNGGTVTLPPPGGGVQQYVQIERLARPAVKEAFEAFANHDATNRSSPYNDPLLPGDITSFMTNVAGRSTTWTNTVVGVLIPDEMQADLSQTATDGAYLGVETGGVTGNRFGGRGLDNDVIALSLGVIFGNTLTAVGVPDDGHESWCLSNDNVTDSGKHFSATFPYLGPPQ